LVSDKRSSIAKEAKQTPVTFRDYLNDPEKYVRRGELVQIVDRIVRLQLLQRPTWWEKIKGKLKGV
jgi:hypothetical protein